MQNKYHSTPPPSKKRSRPVGKSRRNTCTGTLKMCTGTYFFAPRTHTFSELAKFRKKAFAASSQLPCSAQLAPFGAVSYGRGVGRLPQTEGVSGVPADSSTSG